MWGERVRIAREQGMEGIVESTLARWFTEPFREARADVLGRIGADIRSTPVEGFAGCCAAIAQIDVLDRLQEIDVPTLVIVGEHDHGTPPEMARSIHENLRGSSLVIIPSAAHLSNVEQPAAFNKALLDFYQRIGH
jgi:3-oxoadipate enol-lactonase